MLRICLSSRLLTPVLTCLFCSLFPLAQATPVDFIETSSSKYSQRYKFISSTGTEVNPAHSFMLRHTGDIGIDSNNLKQRVREKGRLKFVQTHAGLPVFGTDYGVHIKPDGSLLSISGSLASDIVIANRDDLSISDVSSVIYEDLQRRLGINKRYALPSCEKQLLPHGAVYLYAARCRVSISRLSGKGMGVLSYWIQLDKGTSRFRRILYTGTEGFSWGVGSDASFVTAPAGNIIPGQALVYNTDPLDGPLVQVDLPRLLKGDALFGSYVEVLDDNPNDLEEPSGVNGNFVNPAWDEHSDEIDMLMIYYYIDKARQHFKDIGFVHTDHENEVEQLIAFANVAKLGDTALADNAAYIGEYQEPGGDGTRKTFIFTNGEKFNDPAVTGDTMLHELTHYIVDEIAKLQVEIPSSDGGQPEKNLEAHGLHEGYADFFAAAFSHDPVIGQYICAKGGGCPYEDGLDENKGNNPTKQYLRNLGDNNRRYSGNLPPQIREQHIMGEIWGQALWNLRTILVNAYPGTEDDSLMQEAGTLGSSGTSGASQPPRGAAVAMRLVFDSIGYLDSTTKSMRKAFHALLLADDAVFSGKYHPAIIQALTERGYMVPEELLDSAAPVARAPETASVDLQAGQPVEIDGTQSYVVQNGQQSPASGYYWKISSKPQNSNAAIADPFTPKLKFLPDVPGAYGIDLVVSSLVANSPAKRITVVATGVGTPAPTVPQANMQPTITPDNSQSVLIPNNANPATPSPGQLNPTMITGADGVTKVDPASVPTDQPLEPVVTSACSIAGPGRTDNTTPVASPRMVLALCIGLACIGMLRKRVGQNDKRRNR